MAQGLQPVNIQDHLGQIANLIELCFGENMDSSGRAAVQDMRLMSRSGLLLSLLKRVDSMLKGLVQGFVWVEEGHVIGNVSIYPAGYQNTWVIANVAVHPDYRKKGIAYQLCRAAIDRIVGWRGRAAILQVEADNEPAVNLYYRLGFHAERKFTHWYWSSYNRAPKAPLNMPSITYRGLADWRAEYELAQLVRPQDRGGVGWLKPTIPSRFRITPFGVLGEFLDFGSKEHLIVRGNGHLDAAVLTRTHFGGSSLHFEMMVHPEKRGELEAPLINYLLRRATDQLRGAATEHPADDETGVEALEVSGFEARRHFIHMRLDLLG